MFGLGFQEMFIIGVIALLLFGQRLPEVARTAGKYYTKFRQQLADIQSQVNMSDVYSPNSSSYSSSGSYGSSSSAQETYDDYDVATAPKFEPPPAAPAGADPGAKVESRPSTSAVPENK
jgi:sec-independent protein translocase protein TatA